MNIHASKRLFLVAAVIGVLAVFVAGFFVALAVRSVVAGPDGGPAGPVPNPGHAWTELQGHGVDANATYISTQDNEALELRVNSARALRLEPNDVSPNVIGGHGNNSVAAGVVGAAIGGGGLSVLPNRVTDDYGTVGGGGNNQAGNADADPANATYATVGGGESNTASGPSATVGGGNTNTAGEGTNATVGGGANNIASGFEATVGGGNSNTASGVSKATVAGGGGNTASGDSATVGGGGGNTASGDGATVAGGGSNTASGPSATVGGGNTNTASNQSATVAGGASNIASGDQATVGGGGGNTANGVSATVGGGDANTAGGGTNATVGGGHGNIASGSDATVGGGNTNTASGYATTVGGGAGNTAAGDYSFAAGRQAKIDAAHDGTFLFADQSNFDFNSAASNEFAVRAVGGSRIVTAIDGSGNPTAGVKLDPGDTAWETLSDRDAKENFVALDLQDMLDRLADVPITEWNYKTQDPSNRHIGPMAQDFYAAFGLSDDEIYISPIDTDGVALAAIQGLYEIVQEQDARIDALEDENASLQEQLDGLDARVAALEGGAGVDGGSVGPLSASFTAGGLLLGGLVVGGLVVVQRRRAGGQR